MKLVKLLANLGYGSRKDVTMMLRNGWVNRADGSLLGPNDSAEHEDVRVEDEPLDPAPGMLLMLHKPVGYTCSSKDPGRVIYDLLPPRFRLRNPVLSSIGRLDRETSGLLLMTDDGALLHRIVAPKARLEKCYEVTLADDLRGDEGALFASGTLQLESDDTALAPAQLQVLGPRLARVILIEGRYHQVRRMFAATGNHVLTLQRLSIGGLGLEELAPGAWRLLDPNDLARLFATPEDGQSGRLAAMTSSPD